MEISLNPKMQQWINEKVDSGMYNNSSEIILEGLRLLRIQEEQRHAMIEDLRRKILMGLKQLDLDRSVEFDQAAVKDIKQAGRSRYGTGAGCTD